MNDKGQWRTETDEAVKREIQSSAPAPENDNGRQPMFALKGPKTAGMKRTADRIYRFAAHIERAVRRSPELPAFILSVLVHLSVFILFSCFASDYFGNPFGNGIEASSGDMTVRIDYTGSQTRSAKAPASPSYRPLVAKTVAIRRSSAGGQTRTAKKLAQARPTDSTAPASKAEKPLSLAEAVDAIPLRNAAAKKTMDIPADIEKELGQKLRTAKFEETAAATSEVAARAAGERPDLEDITIDKTGVKYIDEDGAISSADIVAESSDKATAPMITEYQKAGEGQSSAAASNAGAGGNGEKKGGLGPRGTPGGTRKSGLVFEMVENSGYNEVPSFLNGPPEIVYPKWAQTQGVEGCVKVMLEILPNGEVGSVSRVQSPISDALAQELVRQAEMWRFKPVYRNGRALSGNVIVTVDFSLAQKTASR